MTLVNTHRRTGAAPLGYWTTVGSPIGELAVAGDRSSLEIVRLPGTWTASDLSERWTPADRELDDAVTQLGEYFAGQRTRFDLPLSPTGTPFQLSVWRALAEIPFGETETYGAVAARVGNPKASRAVGMANNRNPLAVIVPCHRVIGASGSLVGYGGGLEAKRWLLDHERAVAERLRLAS
jgi:methylated-DNA-[protein]-cysteine S-methyltransferase